VPGQQRRRIAERYAAVWAILAGFNRSIYGAPGHRNFVGCKWRKAPPKKRRPHLLRQADEAQTVRNVGNEDHQWLQRSVHVA